MDNFFYHVPTDIYFGKGQISHLGERMAQLSKKVLLVYGGGSIKRIGLYDEVIAQLKGAGIEYVELSGVLGDGASKEVSKKELLQRASASPAIFNGLVEKQIFEVYYQEIGRLNRLVGKTVELNVLNEHQQRAYHEIMQSFQEKNVCLLHGVTSSGKTEVYILSLIHI